MKCKKIVADGVILVLRGLMGNTYNSKTYHDECVKSRDCKYHASKNVLDNLNDFIQVSGCQI